MRKYFIVISLFIACSFSTLSSAASMPPSWPWHGVSMDNLSSTPNDLLRYEKELGLNVVRLQLKIRKYSKKNGVSEQEAWRESIAWLNDMLDKCKELNIKAVVNVSSFIFDPKIPYNMHSNTFWGDKNTTQHILTSVDRVVALLNMRGEELVAYDFISEPAIVKNGKSISPQVWNALVLDIAKVVNKNDPTRWLVISTAPWGMAKGYENFLPLPYSNIIYGVHVYSPHRFTHQGIKNKKASYEYPGWVHGRYWNKKKLFKSVRFLVEFQRMYDVPVFVGEFSAVRWAKGGEQYIRDLVSIFDEHGWSWLYFSGTGWHGWNPDYNQHQPVKGENWRNDYVGNRSQRWKTLVDIFSGTGAKP